MNPILPQTQQVTPAPPAPARPSTSAARSGSLVKATITNFDVPGEVVTCYFNPKEYAYSKTNSWTPGKMVGSDFETPKFGGSQPKSLQLDLLFDTFEVQTDVREMTGLLWKMMKISPTRIDATTGVGEPPWVIFRWGLLWSFTAVIQSLTERFTLFHPSGFPLRSTVNIQFMQATTQGERWPRQNPTSGSREGFAVHQVKEGETIDWIAFKEYGSSAAYRHLAAANNLDDPSRLYPGQFLLIVPLRD